MVGGLSRATLMPDDILLITLPQFCDFMNGSLIETTSKATVLLQFPPIEAVPKSGRKWARIAVARPVQEYYY